MLDVYLTALLLSFLSDEDDDLTHSLAIAAALCTIALLPGATAVPLYVLSRNDAREGATYGVGPAQDLYSQHVGNPTLFKALTNFSPAQFHALMRLLLDPSKPASYLLKPRDVWGRYGLARLRKTRGRPHKLDPHTRVFLCLVRLKDNDRLVRLCAMSGLNVASVCEDFWHVVECLAVATEHYIAWPNEGRREELASSMHDVQPQPGLMHPIGVVDGTAQFIRRPGPNEPLYYNGRKKRHFINHLVVCDWRGRIMHVMAGFTGKTHDGVAYRQSNLFTNRRAYFSRHQTLLADNGFQGCGLVTPFTRQRGALTAYERGFNQFVRRHRVVIEFVFGAMKSKFGILRGEWRHSLARANAVFLLCCQLMNFYMDTNKRYVRGPAFRITRALEEWERSALSQLGGDWTMRSRAQIRQYFMSPEVQPIYANF